MRNNTIGNDTISSLRLGQACPVLVWSGTNYVGNILVAGDDIPDFDFRLTNTMSSPRVQGNKVALFDLPFYGGVCEGFTADEPDLANNPILENNFVQGTVSWFQPGLRCERFTADDPDLHNNIILAADGVLIGGVLNQNGVDRAAAYAGSPPLVSLNCRW